ncbi:EcoKI restriction-modification system protein HsdS [uncultured Clostridium sp.]|nr:EcoKI restriction-modification system protein HsdS [uncultured Clostridium sp.]
MEKTIKELGIYISDGNYSSKYPRNEEFVEEGIPFIRGNNMVDGDITDDEMYHITPEKHSILLKGHVKTGDVLITTRGNIGQVAIVPDRYEDSNINAQIVLLRTNQETLYNRYLLWALQSHKANDQYLALQTGTALKQLPVGKLEKLSIEVTDINKQHEIADILDKTYEVIMSRRKELQLLDDLAKARFVEMFGDPVKNTQNRPTTEFINVVKMQRGFDLPVQDRQQDGEIPVYGSNGALDHHNEAKVRGGGIITGRSGTIGKVFYTEGDYWPLNTSLFSVNTHGNNVIYLAYLLQMFDLTRFVEGTGVPTLNRNMFHNKQIMEVSIDEQNQFANFVRKIDKSKLPGSILHSYTKDKLHKRGATTWKPISITC